MRAIIIEDEANSRELLQNMIGVYCPDIQIIDSVDSVKNGYAAITKYKPDLVFLDVQINDGTGFDLLSLFSEISFHIIFTTAYQEYAVRAFQYSAVDYLLKPISPEHLIKAIEKISQLTKSEAEIQTLLNNLKQGEDKKIIVKTHDRIYSLLLNEIIRLESDSSYTTIFLKNRHKIMVAKQLKEYEELLSTEGFMRVHQSHLINLEHLFYVHKNQNTAILNDESSVPISVKKRSGLLAYLTNLSK